MPGSWKTQPREKAINASTLDPYVRWAEHTRWRGMTGQAGWDLNAEDDMWVQILARADSADVLDDLFASSLLHVAPTYDLPVPGSNRVRALHFTARVLRRDIATLSKSNLPMRWELSQPLRDAEVIARGSALGRFGPLRNLAAFTATNVLETTIAAARRPPVAKPELLTGAMAVIDFGCPFLNRRFAYEDGQTRVARLWDQGGGELKPGDTRAPCWPWTRPWIMGYGREIGAALLEAMSVRVLSEKPPIDEAEAYRGIDYLIDYDDPRRRVWFTTHGAHVLDVAAGADDPLGGPSGAAGDAPIVFVQLPSMTAADSSGSSLGAHLLDGVRYVLHQCTEDAPIVINISYGSYAGPHNGSSLVESAFQELLELRPNDFAIVLAAGNARQRRSHVKRTVQVDRSAVLRCRIGAGDTTDTFIEAWYERPPAGWTLSARVRGPARVWSEPLGQDTEAVRQDPTPDDVVAMLRNDAAPPTATDLGLVLLALAPTAPPADVPSPVAEPGLWEVELSLMRDGSAARPASAPKVEVNAWIERDDPGQNAGASPHEFVDQDFKDDENTLSSLATGPHTLAVGGFRRDDSRACEYSSVGARGVGKARQPAILAVCEEDEISEGILASAVRSGEVWRMNGTSVAAPALARRVFEAIVYGGPIGRGDWKEVLARLAADDPCLRLPTDDD
jgi:hypothetical protein